MESIEKANDEAVRRIVEAGHELASHGHSHRMAGDLGPEGFKQDVLRARGLLDRIGVLADYFTHGVYRGIKRQRILAAPTDFPVLQGRLGIDQAVRLLEGRLTIRHAGPAIRLIDQQNVNEVGPDESLAPAWFKPTFTVD